MEKINFPKKLRVYIPLLLLFVLLVFLMPRSTQFNYDYKKGSPWMYETLIAQLDFPVLKTEAQLLAERSAAASEVVPYFRNDPKVRSRISSRVAHTDLGEYSYVRQTLDEVLSAIYAKGVISESSVQGDAHAKLESDDLIYVQKGRKAVKMPVSEVYGLEQAEQYFHDAVRAALPGVKVDSVLSAAGLTGLVVPDYVFDQQTTDLIHDDAVFDISRTQGVFRSGQVIVSEGEVVTAEIEQLLNSYRIEYEANVGYNGPKALQWIGNMLIAFSLVLILFLAILFCNYRIFDQYNKYLYLLLVFAISAVVSSVVSGIDQSLFYMMPYTMLALYLLAFFKKRVVFTVYTISLLPLLIFAQNGMELFVMDLTAGVVGILVFGRFNKGWLQFVTAFILFCVMVLVWTAFRFVEGVAAIDYRTILQMGLGAVLSVAGYPLIYLFEKIFRLVSVSKLVDLSDTSNPLLRMLADKAPGTFQHSLQVMNLADAVARAVEADVPLIRTAALYHDVGKIMNPQCFTENQNQGVKYHDGLTPKESAQEIIRHVADGVALAEKHGLPGIIRDFITTHHGTTPAAYFLNTYLNAGGDPDDVADFYYDGVNPTTKEQVILMFCDAVEAASRSLKDYSHENISLLVDRIVDGKISDGQLIDADITLREIAVIKDTMKTYIQQMYHSRVAYPKRGRKS